jgi:hypothetical protein
MNAKMIEYRLKKKDMHIINGQILCLLASRLAAMAAVSKKKTNPIMPHTGTGNDRNME